MRYPGMNWCAIARNSPDDALIKILGSSFPSEAIYAAAAELAKRAELPPCTALYQWRCEMLEGLRDAYIFDHLWRRACDEAFSAESPSRSHPALW